MALNSQIEYHLTAGSYKCVGPEGNKINLFYQLRVLPGLTDRVQRVILINGLQAVLFGWRAILDQLKSLQADYNDSPTLHVITFDNRGTGRTESPKDKHLYSTEIMAYDVVGLMDALGWESAHLAGFSMGGMVALKVAALVPTRILSLFCMGVSGGGVTALPSSLRAWWVGLKKLMWKDMKDWARFDVEFHFMDNTLNELSADGRTCREVLIEEYLAIAQVIGLNDVGQEGQLHAIWEHRITDKDVHNIKSVGNFPIMFIHGRHDIVADPKHGEELASRFKAPCILVNGAHLVARENSPEVALLLYSIITQVSLVTARNLHVDRVMMLVTNSAASGMEDLASHDVDARLPSPPVGAAPAFPDVASSDNQFTRRVAPENVERPPVVSPGPTKDRPDAAVLPLWYLVGSLFSGMPSKGVKGAPPVVGDAMATVVEGQSKDDEHPSVVEEVGLAVGPAPGAAEAGAAAVAAAVEAAGQPAAEVVSSPSAPSTEASTRSEGAAEPAKPSSIPIPGVDLLVTDVFQPIGTFFTSLGSIGSKGSAPTTPNGVKLNGTSHTMDHKSRSEVPGEVASAPAQEAPGAGAAPATYAAVVAASPAVETPAAEAVHSGSADVPAS